MNNLEEQLSLVGGHHTSRRRYRHPTVEPFLHESKKSRSFFDVSLIAAEFQKAIDYITDCGKKGKKILFVGTRPEAADLVKEAAEALHMPYVVNRWIGGTLSNFSEIHKRLNKMKSMEEERDSGAWERRHTKKEQLLLNREYANMCEKFGGISSLSQLPSALFVLDPRKEKVAVKEAHDVSVPIIGFTNGNTDLNDLSYSIIANNTTKKSVEFVLNTVVNAYKKTD